MKYILLILWVLTAAPAWTQDSAPTPQPTATPIHPWDVSKAPWDLWFKKNSTATDKTDYVYLFWDAQDFKSNFEVKEKKRRLAEAALEMVNRLYPSDAKADLIKMDIGYILEKDSYGLPKWDSLQKVAHLEMLKSKAPKAGKKKTAYSEALFKKVFIQFEVY